MKRGKQLGLALVALVAMTATACTKSAPDISSQAQSDAHPDRTIAQAQSDAQPNQTTVQAQSDAQPNQTTVQAQSDAQPNQTTAQAQSDAQPDKTTAQDDGANSASTQIATNVDAAKTAGKGGSSAETILKQMTAHYKSAKTFSTNLAVDMSLQAADGSKQNLPASYVISIEKPNKYSVELVSTRGGATVSNGKRSEFYFQPASSYMIAPAEPTLEESFDKHEFRFVTAGLLNFALIRELMEKDPYAAIMKGVQQAQYLGSEKVDGVDCDHIRLVVPQMSKEIWVQKSNPPLLKKVQPDMSAGLSEKAKRAGNKILLSLVYKDQIFNKSMNDGRFETHHPATAKHVREFFHEEGSELLGKKAPEVDLPMLDGSNIKISSLRDRLVVLDFWATWCPPCVLSMPVFAKESAAFKSKGVVFITVNKGEDAATIKRFMRANKITVPAALDQREKISQAYFVTGIPCTIFIGRDGIVKGFHTGINPDRLKESFIEDMNKFIAGKSLKREQ